MKRRSSLRTVLIIGLLALVLIPGRPGAQTQGPDFDANGKVDFDDIFLFADRFGSRTPADPGRFDLSGNGAVDMDDFFLFAADFGRTTHILRMDDSGVTAAGISEVIHANNRFALEVYSELKGEKGNLFLSPYSISTALAMTYEGARGQTVEEMARVFHFPTDGPGRRAAFAALHNWLNGTAEACTLRTANALWAQADYRFLEAYLSVLQNYYAAKATNVDFRGATERTRQTINTWVEEQTNHKIKDLFAPGAINALTRLVLTNAVYFKGQWSTPFDKKQTRDEAFHVSAKDTVSVPMMRLTGQGAVFKYVQAENVQALELPYRGEKVSMLVLLPRNGDLAAFENALTLEKLEEWRAGLRKQRVDVFLPRFTFGTKYFMGEVLAKMGMPTAFTEGADFSGMDGTRNLAIQSVVHQDFVDVNEEGTEAAAATGVGVGVTSVPPPAPVFRADRPFLVQIKGSSDIFTGGHHSERGAAEGRIYLSICKPTRFFAHLTCRSHEVATLLPGSE